MLLQQRLIEREGGKGVIRSAIYAPSSAQGTTFAVVVGQDTWSAASRFEISACNTLPVQGALSNEEL